MRGTTTLNYFLMIYNEKNQVQKFSREFNTVLNIWAPSAINVFIIAILTAIFSTNVALHYILAISALFFLVMTFICIHKYKKFFKYIDRNEKDF